MFTILADALFTATRVNRGDHLPDKRNYWADRFVPTKRRANQPDRYRHNPYRDLW